MKNKDNHQTSKFFTGSRDSSSGFFFFLCSLLLFIGLIGLFLTLTGCKKTETGPVELEMYDYTGKNVDDFLKTRDYSVALVNYWATYCAPCKKEIPDLVKLAENYKKEGVLVIGASIDQKENLSLITKLARLLKINYPVLYGLPSQFREHEITALPNTFIIKDGKTVKVITGKAHYEDFEAAVKKYLTKTISTPKMPGPSAKDDTIYRLEASYDKKASILGLTLRPVGSYKLSGEGYPPVKITILENETFVPDQKEFTIKGVKPRSSAQWETPVKLTSGEFPGQISLHVSLAACIETTCILVDEKIEVSVK